MFAALSAWTRAHASWRNVFLMAFAAAVGAWVDIRVVAPEFAAATAGVPVFDLQPGLRPEEILAQLPQYTAESIRVYWLFFWLDNAFPFVAFLGLALLWAKLLSYLPAGSSAGWRMTALIPFSTLLFDWSENLAFMSLVQAWPKWWPWLASLACTLHWGKFVCLAVTNAGIVLLALAALATLGSRLRRRATTA